MIKYFLIFICITTSVFAIDSSLEDAYIIEVKDSLNQYQEEELVSNSTTSYEVELEVESEPVAESSCDSCNKIAKPVNKRLNSPKDITIFEEKEIKPINYTNTISLNKLQVSEKKQKFFYMILPAILISKQKLEVKRAKVRTILDSENPSSEDLAFLKKLYKTYKTDKPKKLLNRMQTHPVSIVLAQAAIESGWGESRFFKQGNNIFGMWSVNPNEPRMRAKGTRNGKPVYLRKFATLSDAIDNYFETIGRGAYKSFRKQRKITDDPLQLVQYLVNYCELKGKYTRKLRKFIIANKLKNFDDFKIDEIYLTKNF